jgi:TRAP-type mannitol/chloroaromatic compound transport system substrate-binding protein
MKETRILLNETTFTNLCKMGYFTHLGELGTQNVTITKTDIKRLSKGEIISKDFSNETIKIALQDIGFELVKEIIKRSPMFSEMYYEI